MEMDKEKIIPRERRSRRHAVAKLETTIDNHSYEKEEGGHHHYQLPIEIQKHIKDIATSPSSPFSSSPREKGGTATAAVTAVREWITAQLGAYTDAMLGPNSEDEVKSQNTRQKVSAPRPRDGARPNNTNARTDRFSPRAQKRAAVLICLVPRESGELDVLLTKRSTRLRHHAGEVCFPGGKLEPGETDEQAAMREANEEVRPAVERETIIAALV